MVRPWHEAIRITRDEDTNVEHEYKVMWLWSEVTSVQDAPEDDFRNRAPKTVLYTPTRTYWLLVPYEQLQAEWALWLNDASNIQSVFRNN